MRNLEEKANAARATPAGWMVQVGHEYYTGNKRSAFECWTPFPKFAKVYRRKAWAQKIAAQLGGQVVETLRQPGEDGAELRRRIEGLKNNPHPADAKLRLK